MKAPKLRFKRDDGTEYPAWEEKKLGDVGEVAMCKRVLKEQTSSSGDVPFFKISTFGYSPDAYISFDLYNELRKLYRFPQKGAVLISAAGTIGRVVRYNGEDAYYQDSNIVWLEHNDMITDDYLYHFYGQVSWGNLEGGTIKRLYNKLLLDTHISLPCLKEQQKIAAFLSDLDAVIAASENEVATLEQLKKGAMQKIFSQKVRFRRDDGREYPAWEETKFEDVFDIFEYGMNVASKKFDGENKYIRITDIDDSTHMYSSEDIVSPLGVLDDKYLVQLGDILFARTGASVGKTYIYKIDDGKLYFAGFLIRGHVKASHCAYFIFSQTLTSHYAKWVKITSMRTGQPGINASEYASYRFMAPCFEEQQKIADFLSSFDEAIALARQELDKWKLLKKGLMQQMFV